ncbi:hypothetical protein DFH06DRAFT_1143434 [Mycena polygramma]|nr:hypothetical protein DFH06DRAFT_1143434 [Mycena polygramma]
MSVKINSQVKLRTRLDAVHLTPIPIAAAPSFDGLYRRRANRVVPGYETHPAAVANRTESGTKQTADLFNREKSESCIIAFGVRHRTAVLKQLDTEWECLDVCVAGVTVAVRGRAQGGGERNGLVAGTWSDKQELIGIGWARGSSAWMAPRQCAAMGKLDAAPVHGDAAMWYQVAAVLPCDAARRGAKAADAAN